MMHALMFSIATDRVLRVMNLRVMNIVGFVGISFVGMVAAVSIFQGIPAFVCLGVSLSAARLAYVETRAAAAD